MTDSCPTPAELLAIAADSTSDEARVAWDRHVEACPACQSWFESQVSLPMRPVPPGPGDLPPDAMGRWLATAKSPDPYPGTRLGPYRLEAPIGRGGMGVVYRACDETLGRTVAVKLLPGFLPPDATARFLREIQSASKVSHDHIVPVYAAETVSGGPSYLVMEYVDGPTLRAAASEARGLSAREAVRVIMDVADALIAAHAAGIVHRDVKPANVLLDRTSGRAKLTDFGLARPPEADSLTRPGMIIGTPAYTAPEQLQDPTRADPLADQYGLGATLYEALTGVEPFRGTLEVVIANVRTQEPLTPRQLNPSVPVDLNTICLKALSKDPTQRYASVTAMRDDLRRWQDGLPVAARPVGWPGRAKRWARRNPAVAALSAALAVGGAVGFATVVILWRGAAASERQARDREADARASGALAAEEREKADADYRRAERVVDQFYRKIYEGGTVAAPLNIETRLDLIREAVAFYEEAAARRPGEKPPAELAAARARQGALYNLLKDGDRAAESYRAAFVHYERAERAGTMSLRERREMAECGFFLGVMAGRAGDAAGAARHYQDAVDRLTPLAAVDPQASYFLAGSLANRALIHEYRGENDAARLAHERALDIHRKTRAADPKNGGAFQDLIWTTLAVARLRPDPAASVAALDTARELVEDYDRTYPSDYSRSEIYCAYSQHRADALRRAGTIEEARRDAAAAKVMIGVIDKYPVAFQYPTTRATAWATIGDVAWDAGEFDEADVAWRSAVAILDTQIWPTLASAALKGRLATVCDRLAASAMRRGDPSDAAKWKAKAAETRERLAREHPDYRTISN